MVWQTGSVRDARRSSTPIEVVKPFLAELHQVLSRTGYMTTTTLSSMRPAGLGGVS